MSRPSPIGVMRRSRRWRRLLDLLVLSADEGVVDAEQHPGCVSGGIARPGRPLILLSWWRWPASSMAKAVMRATPPAMIQEAVPDSLTTKSMEVFRGSHRTRNPARWARAGLRTLSGL